MSPIRMALGGMVGMAVAMGIGRFVYTPLLPSMMDGLGLSASDAGVVASANYLGYLAGAILGAGNWGAGRERTVMLAGLAASALLCAAMAYTESLYAFLVIRFLGGLASAFVMVFMSTIVFSHLATADRNDLQAIHFGGVGLGIIVSAFISLAMVINFAAWPSGWLWSAVASAVGFLLVAAMINQGPAVVANASVHEPKLPQSSDLTKIIIAYGLFGFGYIVTATFLIAIVRNDDGGRIFEAVVWLAAGLAGLPSVYLWGLAVRRFGLSKVFAVGSIVEAVGIAASVSLGGVAGPMIGAILLGGTFIAVTAFGLQIGRALAPGAPRRALALMTASFGLGQIIGPIVAGYLADWTGDFTLASLVASAVLFIAAFLALSIRTRL